MSIPVFLSFPKPHMQAQEAFVQCISKHLRERGLESRTLGQTDYDMNAPLSAVRRLMLESNGALVVAFRRYWIENGQEKHGADIQPAKTNSLNGKWMTSPWCHIEAAMAFQLGLPLLIFRERGVHDDGALDRGVTGYYLPEFNLTGACEDYFQKEEWKQLIAQWEAKVRRVRELKGTPQLFGQ